MIWKKGTGKKERTLRISKRLITIEASLTMEGDNGGMMRVQASHPV